MGCGNRTTHRRVYATRAALDRMLSRDRGVVVQVGSAIAYRGIPLQSAYYGAKHAIQGFNEALRCELLASGTRVRTTMVQMPAVNIPQFDWVRSRLPNRAQPVPPIYQPQVAARAVLFAADHPGRRQYWVGASAVATVLANAIVTELLDRYLARTGFDSQQEVRRRCAYDPDAGQTCPASDGQESVTMPRGSSPKRERQYEHIKDSELERGASEKRAKEIAARTVNKERAQHGESKTASRSSVKDMSSSERGGQRSHSGAQGPTKEQLYNEARQRGIRGRSKMTKKQLEHTLGR
ncbi:hypothetical protein KPATCC21470_8283 [Kitasatospora purpeofusca]